MADNRDAIVDAVVARMQQITVANGYLTDAGQRVFRWRSADVAPTECPAIDVRDPDRRPLGLYNNVVRDWELAVECSAFASSGADTDGALNRIVEDILKSVLGGDKTWGGLAIKTTFDNDKKGFDQKDVKVGIAILKFLIQYRNQ
jgi:hypothetical protein